jgi:predicted aminopeptidase
LSLLKKRLFFALIPPLVSVVGLTVCAALFSACYTLKQGAAMLGYLSRAIPLDKLEKQEHTAETQRFTALIRDIRAFATNDLGLKDTKNYTRYVHIDRDYLAAVVSACADDSFAGHRWWFPVVGYVPYKGFFGVDDAKKEAQKLRNKGLDVWVRGVDAFSTLGYFRDPLYSYMRDYSAYQMADLLIHELFHATVFIKNHVQFNEELAEFVGKHGARLYIESRFGKDAKELREYDAHQKDSDVYVLYIQKLKTQLDDVYKSDISREQKLERKAAVIKAAQETFKTNYSAMFTTDAYKFFEDLPVNNAYLQLYGLYHDGGEYLEALYTKAGSNLPAVIEAAKKIKQRGEPPQQQLEALLAG